MIPSEVKSFFPLLIRLFTQRKLDDIQRLRSGYTFVLRGTIQRRRELFVRHLYEQYQMVSKLQPFCSREVLERFIRKTLAYILAYLFLEKRFRELEVLYTNLYSNRGKLVQNHILFFSLIQEALNIRLTSYFALPPTFYFSSSNCTHSSSLLSAEEAQRTIQEVVEKEVLTLPSERDLASSSSRIKPIPQKDRGSIPSSSSEEDGRQLPTSIPPSSDSSSFYSSEEGA